MDIEEYIKAHTDPEPELLQQLGRDGGVELAKELGVRLLAQIPLVTDVCDDGDAGTPIALKDTVMAHEFIHLAHEVTDAVVQRNEQLPPTQKVELKK